MKMVTAVIVVAAIVFVLYSTRTPPTEERRCYYCSHGNQSKLGDICSPSELGKYHQFAISTDSNVCAPAGKSIMEEGGNAIDSAIAVLLCMGVTIPESLGLGGGSMIVIYHNNTKRSVYINAREAAPAKAYRDMFNSTGIPTNRSSFGVESIAVPGELAGYWRMYNEYGSGIIPWKRLFRDAIKFAKDGFPVGQHLQDAMDQKKDTLLRLNSLRQHYVNPNTNELYRKGEILRQPVLAKTLENLANSHDPRAYFYKNLSKLILEDIQKATAEFPGQVPIIEQSDFDNYDVIEQDAFVHKMHDDITLHTTELPGGGPLLSFIIRVMLKYKELYPAAMKDQEKANLFVHRMIEAFKFAFANRMYLGDDRFDNVTEIMKNIQSEDYINFVHSRINDNQTYSSSSGYYYAEVYQNFDHGTAHVSVLDKHGNAVGVTSTVNLYFGSKVISPSTGLILNDEMDDFNTGAMNEFDMPVSYANTVKGGKRPLSSMSPAIFTDDSGVRLVIGASGGPKILTAVAYNALRHFWLKDGIKSSIDSCRAHDQLFPEEIIIEPCFPSAVLSGLVERHHNITELPKGDRGAIVMGISRSRDGLIEANSDYRKGGTVAGI
ncbi:hypothetical protein BLOT_001342 [Blomia tropicalis]|nr:hypothetical protein BLOT_001342 [Blomia tropicalis]